MFELLEGIATEDNREFRRVQETGSQVIIAESQSWLTEPNVPVIGPGGRIMISAEASAITADVVIRKRAKKISSGWRSLDELLASIERRIEERSAGQTVVDVHGMFGYFELSKYERQNWLRPAFLISFRIVFVDDDRVQWGDTIVEPATSAREIGPAEGLGCWVD